MLKKIVKHSLIFTATIMLTACGLFDKDNTPTPSPLVSFSPQFTPRLLWSANTGGGTNGQYLRLSPAIGESAIFTSNLNGVVTATNKSNGRNIWQSDTRINVRTSPGIGNGIVVVGGQQGDIVALQQADGRMLWKTHLDGETLAKPAINNGVVVVKTIDGNVVGLSVRDGHQLWTFQQTEPSLILRGASAPLIQDHSVFIGFANGNLAKLSLNNGQPNWMQPIAVAQGAFAIQRMIDIDADPIIYGHRVFAATYQGNIASLEWSSGRTLWSHDISSYTGMVADNATAYVSDAKGFVWAFGADNGLVNWRQTKLEARVISGPASMGNYVVVGDAEGYLHWLSKQDGHFVARISVGNAIYASPVAENNVLYALTNKGYLVAYTLS